MWRHWMTFFAEHFDFIRYDERGCGMSDWTVDENSPDRWHDDFEDVVAAADPPRPFIVLGISQGGSAAINFAARYPQQVSHLILYGSYAQGWDERAKPEDRQRMRAIVDLTELGWGQDNPVYRQLFTSRFVPDASPEQVAWFNDLCAKTTDPATARKLMYARGAVDVLDRLKEVTVPTLVIHADRDEAVPLSEGVSLAAGIKDASFVQLESRNHILLEDEPAWDRFREEVLAFTGIESQDEDPIFETLSPREREILIGITRGLTNSDIGNSLFISEKTVRNNVTRIFEKLGRFVAHPGDRAGERQAAVNRLVLTPLSTGI